ncbi:MAG: IS30 family transposase [Saprospiraceae bacterium]
MNKHLTLEQRYTISVMIQNKYSQTDIAKTIGKHKSMVCRELKRNSDKRNGEYKADLAQKKYTKRLKEKPKKHKFTKSVKFYVIDKLRQDYSPEQIVGRAKVENIHCVSHETIYKFIWDDKKQGGNLYKHLRHNGRKYRKRGASKDKRGIIPNRTDISLRPKIVDEKNRFGDFEIDTVIGKNHKGALLTMNDRVSSLVFIRKLVSKDAIPVSSQTIETLNPFKNLLHTITADNGKEFSDHQTISQNLNIQFFFARPYHSWERGANENTNGLIRQYFPKGSSFENITDNDVISVQNILNNRPRKKLGFLTPIEFFNRNFANDIFLSNVAFVT